MGTEINEKELNNYIKNINTYENNLLIEDFETKNGFKLPASFKEWLEKDECPDHGDYGFCQFYRINKDPVINIKDVYMVSGCEYLVIGSLADGDPILCKKTKDTDNKLCIYDIHAGMIHENEIYNDIWALMNDIIIPGER